MRLSNSDRLLAGASAPRGSHRDKWKIICLAIMLLIFFVSGSAAQKIDSKQDTSPQPKSVVENEKEIIALGSRCVVFYEGNDLSQDHSSCCTIAGAAGSCWKNDEARSMKVFGPAGTTITVFDSRNASTSDDYFVLEKCDADPVAVGSFDNPSGRVDPSRCWSYFYSGGNGLDGKVSSFRWYDPR